MFDFDKKLFQFYDPRILAAFLTVLTLVEARAFSEPVSTALIPASEKINSFAPGQEVATFAMPKWPIGSSFVIRGKHYQTVSEVKGEVFEDRVVEWLRAEFNDWESVVGISDNQLKELVRKSVKYCDRMGSSRKKDIVETTLVQLMTPGLLEDEKAWRAILNDPQINDQQRSVNFFLMSAGGHKMFSEGQIEATLPEKLAEIDYEYPGKSGLSNMDEFKKVRLKIGSFLRSFD